MKKLLIIIILTICSSVLTVVAGATGNSILLGFHQISSEIEQKIQTQIVDPILGKGNAFVFAEIEMEVITKESEQSKEGSGQISQSISKSTETGTSQDGAAGSSGTATDQYKAAEDEEDLFKGFDFGNDSGSASNPKTVQKKKQKPEETGKTAVSPKPRTPVEEKSTSSRLARQGNKVVEQRLGAELEVAKFSLNILHDSTIPKEKLDFLRNTILSIYSHAVKKQDDMTIIFIPAPFAKKEKKWW